MLGVLLMKNAPFMSFFTKLFQRNYLPMVGVVALVACCFLTSDEPVRAALMVESINASKYPGNRNRELASELINIQRNYANLSNYMRGLAINRAHEIKISFLPIDARSLLIQKKIDSQLIDKKIADMPETVRAFVLPYRQNYMSLDTNDRKISIKYSFTHNDKYISNNRAVAEYESNHVDFVSLGFNRK